MNTLTYLTRRSFGAMALASTAAACAPRPPSDIVVEIPQMQFVEGYGPISDAGYMLPGIPSEYLQGVNRRMTGIYNGEAGPNTLDVDPYAKFLYHVRADGSTTRYPVGVGRAGRSIRGSATMQFKRKWPGWAPTQNMLRTEPEVYGDFRAGIPGGLRSPLGARALYLFRGNRDTYYRIHGTNDLESIGNSGSAGCIRMFNQDVIHLYDQIEAPMRVFIRSPEESLRVDPENFGRGIELPPKIISAEELLGPEAEAADRPPQFDEPGDV
ncbi:MAG: L,D-transpeptidase [Yoonia sp.]|uniref:L,D-transpeptidase n=1 Tax=Yoonia sp. TaxID=2212373 RepID=UPI00274008C1|nr:L,D-transpeptidase [Yoonia sp.]MDP5086844.1 L,D-transpeptidase [Yoonia sp.]